VHFELAQVEVDPGQRHHTGIGLADACHHKKLGHASPASRQAEGRYLFIIPLDEK
jgi:hypothetical protein